TFTFDAETGAWSYTLDNERAATQALTAGEEVTEALEVTSLDGSASETIVVTVVGSNDVPEVSHGSGTVTEDEDLDEGALTTGGQLAIEDPDAGESQFDPTTLTFVSSSHGDGPLGTLEVAADGSWSYRVANDAVQWLSAGEELVQVWQVDSVDGTATSRITVTVVGTNDVPVIGGETTGAVVEAGGVENAEAGKPEVSGQLTIVDPDSGESSFREPEA